MGHHITDIKPEGFCSPKCPQMDICVEENAVLYADDQIHTREVVVGCKNAELCRELRQRIIEDIKKEEEHIRATHVVEVPLARQLKEYIHGPHPRSGGYGKWASLSMEQRHFLIQCANYMEAQEYTIRQLLSKEV